MNMKRRIFTLALALCLLIFVPTASAADDTSLIRQMINYFRHHQEAAETDIYRLLQELESQSPAKAERWQAIMESWLWTERSLDLRSGELPDDLPDDDSLCIVVLGYQLTPNGKMRDELVGRMRVALKAAEQYPNAYIMVTGGATASNNKNATEAGRMAIWLANNGISEGRIIRETQAYSTEANAINCLRILDSTYPQVKHLVLITSDYHMQYSYMLFAARQQLGYGGSTDMVGAACYDTGRSSGYSYATQASAIAAIAGVNVDQMKSPTLSRISSLAVLGDTVYALGDPLDLSATAVYNSGMFRDVSAEAEFSGYDPETLGMQTITVSYTENGITTTGQTTILVQEEDEYVPLPSLSIEQEFWETESVEEEPAPEPEQKDISPWWGLLLIPAAICIYELRQQQLRKQRRRRRRRKRMNWE